MDRPRKKHRSSRAARPVVLALAVALALAALALAACGGDEPTPTSTATPAATAPSAPSQTSSPTRGTTGSDPYAGTWSFSTATLKIDAGTGDFVHIGEGGGNSGLTVEGVAPSYIVVLVGDDGSETPRVPAMLKADIVRFEVPTADGTMPVAFTRKGDGLVMQFGDEETQWPLTPVAAPSGTSPSP
jgi:hypothetical protein